MLYNHYHDIYSRDECIQTFDHKYYLSTYMQCILLKCNNNNVKVVRLICGYSL